VCLYWFMLFYVVVKIRDLRVLWIYDDMLGLKLS